MACYGILPFSYPICQALVLFATTNWHEFNGWAVSQRIKATQLSAPDFLDLIFFYLTKDLEDEESRKKFQTNLDSIEQEFEMMRQGKPVAKRISGNQPDENSKEKEENTPKMPRGAVPLPKWKADPDWRPPGWDEKASMGEARTFMGWQASGMKKK